VPGTRYMYLNTSEGRHDVYLVSLTIDETCMQLAYLPGNDRIIFQSAMGEATPIESVFI